MVIHQKSILFKKAQYTKILEICFQTFRVRGFHRSVLRLTFIQIKPKLIIIDIIGSTVFQFSNSVNNLP